MILLKNFFPYFCKYQKYLCKYVTVYDCLYQLVHQKGTSFYITFRKYVIEIYSIYVTASCFLEILWTCHRNQRFRLREKCFFVLKPPLLKAPIDCSFVGSFNWKIFVHKGAILTTDSQSRFLNYSSTGQASLHEEMDKCKIDCCTMSLEIAYSSDM